MENEKDIVVKVTDRKPLINKGSVGLYTQLSGQSLTVSSMDKIIEKEIN